MGLHHCPHCGFQIGLRKPLIYGNVRIDPSGKISFRSEEIELAPTQYILADALIRARGAGLNRSMLANLIDPDLDEGSITVYIKRLREAFKRLDPAFNQIEVLKGFGAYRWVHSSPS